MRRRDFITFVGGAAVWAAAAHAQQSKMPRIGFLGTSSATMLGSRLKGFLQGLRDFGYIEGNTIAIEYRWAEGHYQRLSELAAELVRANPDLIVTQATPGALAAKRATTTIPIVMALVGDPVAGGLVASVARPGGNITGQSFFNAELRVKRIELLREMRPSLATVAVLLSADNPAAEMEFRAMETAAHTLKIKLLPFRLRSLSELMSAFGEMEKKSIEAIETGDDQVSIGNIGTITALAAKARLLSIGPEDVPRAGGTMAYGIDPAATYRHAASFVDKILKGANPAEIPIERAAKFQFILNLKAAKALGIEVPAATLLRADEVIE